MQNNLKIIITAVDKATAPIQKINNSLSKTLGSTNKIGQIRKIGSFANNVAASIGKVIGPMTGLTGIASVAGVAALASEWGRLGQEIKSTSYVMGISTFNLQSMRGAAQLAGVSSEALTSSVSTLGTTLNDAKWGRNQGALLLLNRLGVGIHMTKDGSIDAIRTFKELATAISNIQNAQTRRMVAGVFGMQDVLPFLSKGAKGIEEYQKHVDELSGIPSNEAIARADAFAKKLSELGVAANGVKNELGDKLIPVLQPLIENMTSWLANNKTAIFSLTYEQRNPGLLGESIPLGIRSNNPLNMQPGGKEAVYPTMRDGIRAALGNLQRNYFDRGIDTADSIGNKWTPANAPGNSRLKTNNWISGVAAEVGSGHIDSSNPQQMAKLLSAMIKQENGVGSYDAEKMKSDVAQVVIEFKNAPPGTTASAKTKSGATAPVRINTTMNTMVTP